MNTGESFDDFGKERIDSSGIENINEVGINTEKIKTPEDVFEKLNEVMDNQTELSITTANTKMYRALSLGASPEDIEDGKKLLSPVQQKMEDLKNEYFEKFDKVINGQ